MHKAKQQQTFWDVALADQEKSEFSIQRPATPNTSTILDNLLPLNASSKDASGLQFGHSCLSDKFQDTVQLGQVVAAVGSSRVSDKISAIDLSLHVDTPFTLAIVGNDLQVRAQAAACVLQAYHTNPSANDVLHRPQQKETLILHRRCDPDLPSAMAAVSSHREHKVTVLTSPWYHSQRSAVYGGAVELRPLWLRWESLSADDVRSLLGVSPNSSSALTVGVLRLLRKYQRSAILPPLPELASAVRGLCAAHLEGAAELERRLDMLEALSGSRSDGGIDCNDDDSRGNCVDYQLVGQGELVIADLTDPLLPASDAAAVFGVLISRFLRSRTTSCHEAAQAADGAEGQRLLMVDVDDALAYSTVTSSTASATSDQDSRPSTGNSGLNSTLTAVARTGRVSLTIAASSGSQLGGELLSSLSSAILHEMPPSCPPIAQLSPLEMDRLLAEASAAMAAGGAGMSSVLQPPMALLRAWAALSTIDSTVLFAPGRAIGMGEALRLVRLGKPCFAGTDAAGRAQAVEEGAAGSVDDSHEDMNFEELHGMLLTESDDKADFEELHAILLSRAHCTRGRGRGRGRGGGRHAGMVGGAVGTFTAAPPTTGPEGGSAAAEVTRTRGGHTAKAPPAQAAAAAASLTLPSLNLRDAVLGSASAHSPACADTADTGCSASDPSVMGTTSAAAPVAALSVKSDVKEVKKDHLKTLMTMVKEAGGSLSTTQLSVWYGNSPGAREEAQRVGGVRKFCEQHSDKIEYAVTANGSVIRLLGTENRPRSTPLPEPDRRVAAPAKNESRPQDAASASKQFAASVTSASQVQPAEHLDMLVEIVKNAGGCMTTNLAASWYIASPGARAEVKRCGGLQSFCELHAHIIEYTSTAKGDVIRLVANTLAQQNGGKSALNSVPARGQSTVSANLADTVVVNQVVPSLTTTNFLTSLTASSENIDTVGRAKVTQAGLPLRPSEPACAFYLKTGTCRYGVSCIFNHPPKGIPAVHSSSAAGSNMRLQVEPSSCQQQQAQKKAQQPAFLLQSNKASTTAIPSSSPPQVKVVSPARNGVIAAVEDSPFSANKQTSLVEPAILDQTAKTPPVLLIDNDGGSQVMTSVEALATYAEVENLGMQVATAAAAEIEDLFISARISDLRGQLAHNETSSESKGKIAGPKATDADVDNGPLCFSFADPLLQEGDKSKRDTVTEVSSIYERLGSKSVDSEVECALTVPDQASKATNSALMDNAGETSVAPLPVTEEAMTESANAASAASSTCSDIEASRADMAAMPENDSHDRASLSLQMIKTTDTGEVGGWDSKQCAEIATSSTSKISLEDTVNGTGSMMQIKSSCQGNEESQCSQAGKPSQSSKGAPDCSSAILGDADAVLGNESDPLHTLSRSTPNWQMYSLQAIMSLRGAARATQPIDNVFAIVTPIVAVADTLIIPTPADSSEMSIRDGKEEQPELPDPSASAATVGTPTLVDKRAKNAKDSSTTATTALDGGEAACTAAIAYSTTALGSGNQSPALGAAGSSLDEAMRMQARLRELNSIARKQRAAATAKAPKPTTDFWQAQSRSAGEGGEKASCDSQLLAMRSIASKGKAKAKALKLFD